MSRKIGSECSGSVSVDRLLWSLQERMQGGTTAPQWSAALKNFKAFSCTARRDGVYPDLATECTLYYRCLDGAVYSYSCPSGEALGYKNESCRPAAEVTCPRLPPSTPPCLNQTNGYYPDYTQACRGYYRCDNGSVNGRWFCENSGLWDVATGSCGSGSGLTCTPPSCWGPSGWTPPDPGLLLHRLLHVPRGRQDGSRVPIWDYFRLLAQALRPQLLLCVLRAGVRGAREWLPRGAPRLLPRLLQVLQRRLGRPEGVPSPPDLRRAAVRLGHELLLLGRGARVVRRARRRPLRRLRLPRLLPVPPPAVHTRLPVLARPRVQRARVRGGHERPVHVPGAAPRLRQQDRRLLHGGEDRLQDLLLLPGRQQDERAHVPGHQRVQRRAVRGPRAVPVPREPAAARAPRGQPYQPGGALPRRRPRLRLAPQRLLPRRALPLHALLLLPRRRQEFVRSCPAGERFNGLRCVSQTSYKCPVIAGAPECLLRGDGVYQDLESGCSTYYQCLSGVKIEFRCPEGRLHNGRSCELSVQVYCPAATLCSHQRRNTTLVDTARGCQGYFRCQEDVLLWYRTCARGQVFNGKECVPYFFYTCPARVSTVCLAKPDGLYQDLSTRCRSFYECRAGERVATRICGDDELFNGDVCVSAASYVCPVDGAKECGVGRKGFVQDIQSGCRRYYYCYGGKSFARECPGERVFNGHTCVPSTQYRCPSGPKGERPRCSGPDGYYPDLHTSCRSFYYCRGGHRINYTCPDGEAFNGVQCVPETAFTCSSPSSCQGKINGFYQDVFTGCRKYYYCYGGFKYAHTCPGEQVHNGRTCVPASTYTCPSPTDDRDCVGKFSGLFPDLTSRCQVYYKCQGGVKTQTLACPHSQVFNGYKCVPFYEFSCSSFGLVSPSSPARLDLTPDQLLAETGALLGASERPPPSAQLSASRDDAPLHPDQAVESSGIAVTQTSRHPRSPLEVPLRRPS
ncbi:uncharacterized protein LOC125047923 [Penaeus chinensis]|uniref:uncharacterized protein LOC125047923 n=1 Tax=Penaeus chinensis TaxID=139456 RepID=UPI001FB76046|nr:uncharacterized protein LOC125047923 [Penaeus chinensis]